MLKTIITIVAAVAALAAAAIAPVDYIDALRTNPIGMVLSTFVAFTSAIYIGYVVFNFISGLLGQGDAGRAPTLYWIDYVASWLAWFSFNLTGLWVALGIAGIAHGFAPVTGWADVPNAYWVLLGLVVFSWGDVGVLQGHKHGPAMQYVSTQRSIVPAPVAAPAAPVVVPPAPPPTLVAVPIAAPSRVGTGLFVALGIVVILIVLAFCFSGKVQRHALNDDSKDVAYCERQTGDDQKIPTFAIYFGDDC